MENFINMDKNMIVNTTIGDVDVTWHDVRKAPFSLYGFHNPETEPFFYRLSVHISTCKV